MEEQWSEVWEEQSQEQESRKSFEEEEESTAATKRATQIRKLNEYVL